ncbi:EmrB/QacA subfamily drug resistance transporter [Microbacteriaceae bacterium MWH-Ta3]|nr:EmrB/QacA subfamily drug resistance transporter [Microbacteriaceae bacterium MWH-Ta3]
MASSDESVMTKREILFVMLGLMSGMFLSALDQTIVGTSMRTIADDLDGLALQAWVTTAYLIVSTVVTPIAGKLSDIYGRRPIYIISIVIFLAGSLLSGLANSMYELAAYRALQGLGGGGLMSLAFTIVGDMLPPRERVKYQGFFIAVFGTSSFIGPLIGGFFAGVPTILGVDGWRWVFLVNIPVGIVALYMVWRFLHVPQIKHKARIDWWGVITVIVAVVPLLLVAEQGRIWGWASPEALACYGIGLAGIVGFIVAEKAMGADAIIPLGLFKTGSFTQLTVLGVLVGFAMFGAMMTIPLFLQLVLGSTPTESGFQTIPMVLGMMVATGVGGQFISRTGKYKPLLVVGTGLLVAAFFWLSRIDKNSDVTFLMVGMVIVGLGLGMLMQTLTIAAQNAVEARNLGVATSSTTFFRQIGGTLGTAILFSVLFSRIPEALSSVFARSDVRESLGAAMADPAVAGAPQNAGIVELLTLGAQDPDAVSGALEGDTSFLTGADDVFTAPFLEAFAVSAQSVYTVSLFIAIAAFIMSWFIRAEPLREKSAMDETHADAAAAAGH